MVSCLKYLKNILSYLHEVPQTQTNPKQHLENSNDDGNLHLVSIQKYDFVFCYLQQ